MKSSLLSFRLDSLLALTVVIGIASGCANGPRVSTKTTQGRNYSHFHSFAVMPPTISSPQSDPALMSRVADPARRTAVETLASLGLRETTPEQADLLVTLRGQIAEKEKISEWGYLPLPVSRVQLGSYQGGDRPRGKTIRVVEERTLSIDVVDNHTKQLAWTGELATTSNERLEAEQVQEAVRRVLAEFPAGPEIASVAR